MHLFGIILIVSLLLIISNTRILKGSFWRLRRDMESSQTHDQWREISLPVTKCSYPSQTSIYLFFLLKIWLFEINHVTKLYRSRLATDKFLWEIGLHGMTSDFRWIKFRRWQILRLYLNMLIYASASFERNQTKLKICTYFQLEV